ncbi:unnamed protein product, partial [Rotaria socialis]
SPPQLPPHELPPSSELLYPSLFFLYPSRPPELSYLDRFLSSGL